MTPSTQAPDLPERFAARGQEFIDELQSQCRYACGVLWWRNAYEWVPARPGTVSLYLRCQYNVTHKEATQIRRTIPSLEPGPDNPEFMRAVRRYARRRGMQLIDGHWVRVPKSLWDAMTADEMADLIMQEYDQGAFSPEDWKKLTELHAEEIRLCRGAGKKLDAAGRVNFATVVVTNFCIDDDIRWIHHQMNEIFKRTYPQEVS